MSTAGWEITKSAYICAGCNAELKVGQAYFSALAEEQTGFARRDYCTQCWGGIADKKFFSFWKTRRLKGDKPPRMDAVAVFDFFSKLAESDSPDRKELRFVLALYLTRRKTLKLKGVKRDGEREVLEFCRPRRQEVFEVENPNLTEEQISAATARLKELFHAEL
jgi:hypothetical protein